MENPSGIPPYSVPFLAEDGKTVSTQWYRYLRKVGSNSAGAVILVQDTLANRPDAAAYADGSILFIDTNTSLMYYVQSSAWVQVMNFVGYDGATVTIDKPTDVIGNLAVTGKITSTAEMTAGTFVFAGTHITATTVLSGNSLIVSTTAVMGGATQILTGGLTVTAGGAAITGNSTVTGTFHATQTVTADTGLTVNTGGATVTGDSTITGKLNCTSDLTASTLAATTTVTAGSGFVVGADAGESNTITIPGPATDGSITFEGGIETAHVDPT